MLSGGMSQAQEPEPVPSDSRQGESAAAIWLKLIGLLAVLTAFGFLIYYLSRIVHRG